MSLLRSLSAALLSAAASFSLLTGSGCNTGAVGVDACRDVEQARCRAGLSCGLVSDVEACERYYRDHCLHGLATAPPPGADVSACVNAIQAAGRCAEGDPDAALGACDARDGVPSSRPGLSLACDVVEHPERTPECAFLTDLPPEEGAGGQSSGGGGEAGAAGSGLAGAAGASAEGLD